MFQLDGRRAPVTDLLALTTSVQPIIDHNNRPTATGLSIPSTESELEGGGISGSPPAILDNWLELQRALTLASIDNGNAVLGGICNVYMR